MRILVYDQNDSRAEEYVERLERFPGVHTSRTRSVDEAIDMAEHHSVDRVCVSGAVLFPDTALSDLKRMKKSMSS